MLLAALAICIAVPLALVRGGSLDRLVRTRFKWTPLLFASLGIQLVIQYWTPSDAIAFGILLASFMGVAIFLAVNHRLPGTFIALTGLALNLLVIALNGAMPVRTQDDDTNIDRLDHGQMKHERMTSDTVLPWLGDVIPLPGLRAVASVGDLVLGAGAAWLVYRQTRFGDDEMASVGAPPSD